MARHRRRSLTDRYRPEAELAAQLRSSPERRALGQTLDEAASSRDATIQSAHGTAAGLRASIRAARPEFSGLFDTAGSQLAANRAAVVPNMGPGGSAIAAAAAGEHGSAVDRNTAARASTLGDLSEQGVRASEGEAFAVRQAHTQYQSDAGKILKQLLGVSADEGQFAAAELGRLVDAARGRGQSERNSIRSSGIDPSTGKPIPGGKLDPDANGKPGDQVKKRAAKWLPPKEQNTARDTILGALDWAKDFNTHGATRPESAVALRKGAKEQTIENVPVMDTATGKQKISKDGLKVYKDPDGNLTTRPSDKIAGSPQFKEDVYVQAALDVAYDGHLSRRTQQMLHKRGIKVRDLGLPTYQQWRRQNRQPPASGGPPSSGAAGYPYGRGAGQVH